LDSGKTMRGHLQRKTKKQTQRASANDGRSTSARERSFSFDPVFAFKKFPNNYFNASNKFVAATLRRRFRACGRIS
jgi:hypothetical protein